jgi:hypothetical protein
MLRFLDGSPVYFDRHTLSVKDGTLSLYTLDGRMRFLLTLSRADEANFLQSKLREVVLSRNREGAFQLAFLFGEAHEETDSAIAVRHEAIPDYVKVEVAA